MVKRTLLIFFSLPFFLAATSCLKEDEFTLELNHSPRMLDDGWVTSAPENAGMVASKLQLVYELIFDEKKYPSSRSLLIVRDGKLVSESYIRCESHITYPQNIQGITKGITSLLFGIALEKGYVGQFDHRLYRYIPEYFGAGEVKRSMNFHHVLTMQSGLKWDNERDTPDLFNYNRFPSSLRVVLQKESVTEPGNFFNYSDGDAQLISGVISKTSEMPLEEFASDYLFDKMGIHRFMWEKHTDGFNYGGLALYLTPRDLARIGLLMIENGKWLADEIVPGSWIEEAASVRTGDNESAPPYGYFWWIDTERNGYYAKGRGGQFLYILPEYNLAVIHTASPYTSEEAAVSPEEFFVLLDMIIDSVE